MEIWEEDAEIEIIYHIGDIHVMKNNHRDVEYQEVFEKLYQKIKNDIYDCKKALIVCTGDVFNDGLSPSSIILVKNFFSKLSELCEIVIFRGNHDQTSRSNQESIDFLFPVLYKLETKNKIYIFGKTGAYLYGNIVFGYTDVYENQVYKIEDNNKKIKNKIKIGLWHGTMNGSKIDNNNELEGKFSKSDFEGYDYVLLGDIHKWQYLNKEKTIAYCGSTLQLNFGENIENHGYLRWDLKNKKSEHIHIKNNYGFLTVRIKDNVASKYDKLIVPKNINLRIIYENSDNAFVDEIYNEISKSHNIMSYFPEKKSKEIKFVEEKEGEDEIVDEKSLVKKLMEYIKKNKDENMSDEDYKKIEELINEKIKEIDYKYSTEKRNIKLKNLCFNNFNIYGEDNCIDFEALKGIVNVSGPNGIGKSSLIQCILYSIYGICEDSSIGKYDYINVKERNMETLITLDINGIEYQIFRECRLGDIKKTEKNIVNNVIIYQNKEDISGKSLPEINKQIYDLVGEPENFKNICIMEQKRNESFLNLKDSDKTEYLFKILKLDIFNELCDVILSEAKMNNKLLTQNNEKIYSNAKQKTEKRDEIIEKKLEELKKNMEILENEETEIMEKYNRVNKEKIESELKYDQLKEFDKKEEFGVKKLQIEKNKKNNDRDMEILEKEIRTNSEIFEKNEKIIKEQKNMEEKNIVFEEKKKKDIAKINDEINKLFEGYTKIEKMPEDIKQIEKDKINLEEENVNLNKRILLLEEDIEKIQKDIKSYENKKDKDRNYNKYLEMKSKIEEIQEKKRGVEIMQKDLIDKKNKKEKEYKKIKEKKEDMLKKNEEIQKNINNYGDMESKKKVFEKENNENINLLNDEIHRDLENYIKVTNSDFDLKIYDEKIKSLEKDREILLKNIIEIEEKIKKYSNDIVDININSNSDSDSSSDFDYDEYLKEKYEKYLCVNEEKNKKEEELKMMKKKIEENKEYLKKLSLHEYNKDCEICMKNKLTQDLIKIENDIKTEQKNLEKCEKEFKKIEKKFKKYESYKEKYEEREKNIKKNNELNALITNENNKKETINEKIKYIDMELEMNKQKKEEYEKIQNIIMNNKILDERIMKNKKLLEELKIKKMEDYEKYVELIKKKSEIIDEIKNLENPINEYDKLLLNIQDINLTLEKCDEEDIEIRKKYKKYENCGDIHDEYQKNIITVEKKMNDLELCKKNYQINSNKINLLNSKIEENEKNKKIEEENKKVMIQITEKKKLLNEITFQKLEGYEEYIKLIKENENLSIKIMRDKLNYKNLENLREELNRGLIDTIEILKKVEIFEQVKIGMNQIKEDYEEISKKVENLKKEKMMITSKISELSNELKNIKALIIENEKIKSEYDIRIKIGEIIKDGFIDNLLTYNVIPDLCDCVNTILSSFVNYKIHMEYNNKKVSVFKKDQNNMLSNASKLSGYETLMANIAFRLAINSDNKLQKTNFFVIDEGFAFCDEQSVPKISNLFGYMRTLYDFIIVVSHNEQIKMYTDMNLQIIHQNGYSLAKKMSEKNKDILMGNILLLNKNSHKKKEKIGKKEKNKKDHIVQKESKKLKKIIKKNKESDSGNNSDT
jgi:DNA repair exonuclease SbcCD ATPase subunit